MADLIALSYAINSGLAKVERNNSKLIASNLKIGYIDIVPRIYQENIKAIYLGSNYLTTVDGLKQFEQVLSLSLASNRLNDVFYVFEYLSEHLPQLESLQLSGNPFCRYPNHLMHAIAKLKNLCILDGRRINDNDVAIANDFVNKELALIKMLSVNASMISKLSHIVNKLRLHHEMNSRIPSITFDVNSLLDIVGDKYEMVIGNINILVQPAYEIWCKRHPQLLNLGVSVNFNDLLRTWCDEVLPDLVTEQQRSIAKLIRDVEVLKQEFQRRRINDTSILKTKRPNKTIRNYSTPSKSTRKNRRNKTPNTKRRHKRPNTINQDTETLISLDMMSLASEASLNLQNHTLNDVLVSPRSGITVSRPQSPLSPHRQIKSPNQLNTRPQSPNRLSPGSPYHQIKSPNQLNTRPQSPSRLSPSRLSTTRSSNKSPKKTRNQSSTSRPNSPLQVHFRDSQMHSYSNNSEHFFPSNQTNSSLPINLNNENNVIERLVHQLKRFKEQNETNVQLAAKKITALNLQNATQNRAYNSRIDSLRSICTSLERQVLMYRSQISHLQNMSMDDKNLYSVLDAQLKAAHECSSEITNTLAKISKQYENEIHDIQNEYEKLHYVLLESNDEKTFMTQLLKYRHMYMLYKDELAQQVDYFHKWLIDNPRANDKISVLRYKQSLHWVKKCWYHWIIYVKRNRMIKKARFKRLNHTVMECFKSWKKYGNINKLGIELSEKLSKQRMKQYFRSWQRVQYKTRENKTVLSVCDKFYERNCKSKAFHIWCGQFQRRQVYYNDQDLLERMKDKIKQVRRKWLCGKVLKVWFKDYSERKHKMNVAMEHIIMIRKRNYINKWMQALHYNQLMIMAEDHHELCIKRNILLALRLYKQIRCRKRHLMKISYRFAMNRYLLKWWHLYKLKRKQVYNYNKSIIFWRTCLLKRAINMWKIVLVDASKIQYIKDVHEWHLLKLSFKNWHQLYFNKQINKFKLETLKLKEQLTIKDNECHALQEESNLLSEQLGNVTCELSSIHNKISGMYLHMNNNEQLSNTSNNPVNNIQVPTSPIHSTISIELL